MCLHVLWVGYCIFSCIGIYTVYVAQESKEYVKKAIQNENFYNPPPPK